jgi:hypothetical protein
MATDRVRPALLRSPSIRLLAAASVVLVVLTVAAAALALWQLRASVIAQARQGTIHTSALLAEHAARDFQAIDIVLRDVADQLDRTDLAAPEDLRARAGTRAFHDVLATGLGALVQVDALAVLDVAGHLLNTTRAWPVPASAFPDSDVLAFFRAHARDELFVSAPALSRATGQWTLFLGRRVDGRDGTLRGVVIAVVELSYYERFYATAATGEGACVAGQVAGLATLTTALTAASAEASRSLRERYLAA